MRIIRDVQEMQATSRSARAEGSRIVLVPTMGALHEGHLSLVRTARAQGDLVVVSIFVNPLQFGPTEDFSKYPRTLERDCQLLGEVGADIVFAPTTDQMYPKGASTIVLVQDLSTKLDGRSRPGHFQGVTTVVAKLFEIVRPQFAVFGQKDAAQVAVLKRMVRDLNMDIELIVAPIVREPDGLAMSSRNAYLSPQERQQALVLSRSLKRIQELIASGEVDSSKLLAAGTDVIASEPGAKLDYFEVINPETLDPVQDVAGGALIAVAAWIGNTRLIDNCVIAPR